MIQEKFMRELYERAGKQYNIQPNEQEFAAWMDVLAGNSYSDVDAALRRWSGNTAVDFSGRVLGARMPKAAELKSSIQNFDNSQSDRFIPCDQCEFGWVRVRDGKTVGGSDIGKTGAMKLCTCWINWARYRKGIEPGKPELVAR
jgi:hypothetical protein